jgi:hypothetical protein
MQQRAAVAAVEETLNLQIHIPANTAQSPHKHSTYKEQDVTDALNDLVNGEFVYY